MGAAPALTAPTKTAYWLPGQKPPHGHQWHPLEFCARVAPWRDLPARYGAWSTVAGRFYHWRKTGLWQQVLAALQAEADAEGKLNWAIHFVDGSVIRAHQHAAGAKRGT